MKTLALTLALCALALPAAAQDTTAAALLAGYETAAGAPADAAAGRDLFLANHTGGKPDTPSCTTCHGTDPTKAGQARTGKAIEPLAPSATPARFTDAAKVEKWFGRNCESVLGRACSEAEKANVLAWLMSL